MRIVRLVLTSALLLAAAAAASAAESARGSYQFTLGDKFVKYLEFDAQGLGDGSATGRMFFRDDATVVGQDVDGTGEKPETHQGFYISADIDAITVSENRAIMSGTVRDASISSLLGRRVLLTVEDNGYNSRIPDRLTWGVYDPTKISWTPSDAEWKEDPGVGLRWWATDAERKDDRGYEMPRDGSFTTQTYPLAAYSYADADNGAGDIVVQP